MSDYLIFTDASADIDFEFAEKYNIGFVPMEYTLGDEDYICNGKETEEQLKKFYDCLRDGKTSKTTQINPYCYEEFFAPYLEKGLSVLYLCLSSGLSSTYHSACTAAENLKKKFPEADFIPVDSLYATTGMGIFLEKMAANREKGMTILENKKAIEGLRGSLFANCYVEDLMHLKRGGRISAAKAVFGILLGIKPIITFTDHGTLEMVDKKKGTRQAVSYMVENYKKYGDLESDTPVYVCDSDAPEMARYTVEKVLAANPRAIVKSTGLSPIIGTHLGPGSVVLFYEKKK